MLRPKKATKESENPTATTTKSKKTNNKKTPQEITVFSHAKMIPRQETWKLKSLE
jgi:hypothetical protein